jgi:MinD-like ATPase involved in chromosome partitioning or flagellar assembly
MTDLLHRTVVVLNDSHGHADKHTRAILAQQFANHGLVVIEVPFDPHLRPGGVIDVTNNMSPKTRRRLYEIAAAIADHFASTAPGTARTTMAMTSHRATSSPVRGSEIRTRPAAG